MRAGGSLSLTGTGTVKELSDTLVQSTRAQVSTGDARLESDRRLVIGNNTDDVNDQGGIFLGGVRGTVDEGGSDEVSGGERRTGVAAGCGERVEVLCTGSLYVVAATLEAFGADIV